jgi:hypothetical protein
VGIFDLMPLLCAMHFATVAALNAPANHFVGQENC